MELIGKSLIMLRVIILIIGVLFLWGNKIPFLGRLPGDIFVRRGNFSFYFPISTCIIVSLILTLIFTLFLRK